MAKATRAIEPALPHPVGAGKRIENPKLTPQLTFKGITAMAERLIMEQALADISNEEKMVAVIDKLIVWLDNQISYGKGPVAAAIDAVDHVFIRFLAKMLAQEVFERLREQGRL